MQVELVIIVPVLLGIYSCMVYATLLVSVPIVYRYECYQRPLLLLLRSELLGYFVNT